MISILIITMGHNSIKKVCGVTVFVVCISSDYVLHSYQLSWKYLEQFQSYEADTICERQIERATVTDGETNGQTCKYGKNNVSPKVGEK